MVSSYEVAMGPRGYITRDTTYEYGLPPLKHWVMCSWPQVPSTWVHCDVPPLQWSSHGFHVRLLVQCRYIGRSVEALVIEVGPVPPLVPVAAPGPLRVELRLANGQCSVKGCVEGWSDKCMLGFLFFSCRWSVNVGLMSYLHRGCGLQLLLHGFRLPCDEGAQGSSVCWGPNAGEDWSQTGLDSGTVLGNGWPLPSQHSTVGPADWWVRISAALTWDKISRRTRTSISFF